MGNICQFSINYESRKLSGTETLVHFFIAVVCRLYELDETLLLNTTLYLIRKDFQTGI